MVFGEIKDANIHGLVDRSAREFDLWFKSLLDVGSSDRPAVDWFSRYQRAIEPRSYAAVEVDPAKVAVLQKRGLQTYMDVYSVSSLFDLTLAIEVIEHISEEESVPFLKACRQATRQMFVLTTPNCEYWKRFRALQDYRQLRWIPALLV